jgi:hypothetical protein
MAFPLIVTLVMKGATAVPFHVGVMLISLAGVVLSVRMRCMNQ